MSLQERLLKTLENLKKSKGAIVITAINTLKVPNEPNEFHRVFLAFIHWGESFNFNDIISFRIYYFIYICKLYLS